MVQLYMGSPVSFLDAFSLLLNFNCKVMNIQMDLPKDYFNMLII